MGSTKTRDSGCCSVNFLKYVIHVFNIIFLFAGATVLAVGIWSIVDRHQYVSLLPSITYALTSYVLVVAGGLVFCVAIIGCCAVWKEQRCKILCYTFLLLLIFLLEAMVGILAYIYAEQVDHELQQSLNNTFLENYKIDSDKTEAIDRMQQEFKCCGAIRSEDWEFSRWRKENMTAINLVPDSCCKTQSFECGRRTHPSNINDNGCLSKMTEHIKSHLIIVGAIGLGFCLIQVIGMIFSCCLYIKLKHFSD